MIALGNEFRFCVLAGVVLRYAFISLPNDGVSETMVLAKRLLRAVCFWAVISLVMLSAWGWQKMSKFSDQLPRALLMPVWLGLASYGAIIDTRTSASGGKWEVRKHRRFFWQVALPVLSIWFLYLPFADSHQLGINTAGWIRWAGLIVFTVSMGLRIEAIRAQGPQFSMAVAIQEGHRLATHGPYRMVRHPAYLGVIGIILGISLVFANLLVGILMSIFVWIWMEARN